MIPTQDPLWDVRDREAKEEAELRRAKERLEREINLGRRASTLQHQPGYQDFVKAVEGVHQAVITKMVGCNGDDSLMRVLQGKAQALGDVLTLLTKSDRQVAALEIQLKTLQNEEAQLKQRRPKNQGGSS